MSLHGVGIDETTHTVTYTISTPNNREGQVINNIDYKLDLQEGTTNIIVDAVKVPRNNPVSIPLLNISSNQLVYNINNKEPLKISYQSVNTDEVEYSIGNIKRKIGPSGTIILSSADFKNGIGSYTLYAQARNKTGGGDIQKVSIVVESKEFLPGPDITHINYPQNIKGADFKQFNVPFNVSWQSINTDYIRIYAGKYNPESETSFFLGQFSKSGVVTLTVEDVLKAAKRKFDEDDNILQFKLLLVPFNLFSSFKVRIYSIAPLTTPSATSFFLFFMCCFCVSAFAPPKYGTACPVLHMISVTCLPSTRKSPNTLPNLPFMSSPFLLMVVCNTGLGPSNDFSLAFAANPNFFSILSLVLDSGVSMPMILTRSFICHIPKPRSMSTSTVSPSTTLFNLHLYVHIIFSPLG